MKIAILGTRGIPGRYGGFETFADELSRRLVTRGHDVYVYGRSSFFNKTEEQVGSIKQIKTGTIFQKYLETPIHAITSNLDARNRNFDVALICNAANSPFAWILSNTKKVINVDGIERKRSKWNALGKLWYRLGEYASVLFADKIVADADVIADYYKEKFDKKCEIIPYGYRENPSPDFSVLEKFNIKKDGYILYVSRFEPENNPLGVVQAYSKVKTEMPLVMVGDAPYATNYIQQVKNEADSRVIFTGYQFGAAYEALMLGAHTYIQATEVGGTHPALVEAMGFGKRIIANDVPEHREVLLDCGIYYQSFDELGERLLSIPDNYQEKAKNRAKQFYSWDSVTEKYERLFEAVVRGCCEL